MTTLRLLFFSVLLQLAARAHPVAQGSMDLDARPDHIAIRVRVSNEQIFVATGFAAEAPANPEAMWPAHGAYLLSRIEVAADGAPLAGTVVKHEAPADRSVRGFTIYELRYPLAAAARELRLRQTLLNEIAYAPGNPWEATFSVRATAGGTVIRDAALFTHREPLVLALTIPGAPGAGVFGEYLRHGIHHILAGWDHLLFMAALVLAVRRIGELIAVVTTFTIAHTLTLALSVFDVVRLPSHIVEPMIAASIVVVAVQNISFPAQTRGPLRLALAFGFGLFHGLGFAGGLLEAMQSGASVGTALVAFSIGVELGHQVVVIPIFVILAIVRARMSQPEMRERFSLRTLRAGSALIAAAGCFYLVDALRSGGV
jgi:HupE / UreJ protein